MSTLAELQQTDAVAAERLSRELARTPSHESGSDIKDKLDSDGHNVNTIAYEKGANNRTDAEEDELEPYDVMSGEQFPIDSIPDEEGDGFTIRAVVVGSLLGLVIAASNVYLGLKTGFTFGAGLFGALAGCAIIKAITRTALSPRFGGGFFGPRENVTVQSAATAAGSLTGMFVAAIPAAAQLGLLNPDPMKDFGRFVTFTLCSAYYGAFFAIPLRKFYILRQKLVFPSPTATALAIRAMHARGGDVATRKKTRMLFFSFITAFIWCIVQQYAPSILQEWNFGYLFYVWGAKNAIKMYNYNFGIVELTPAFFGAGILSGMNASWSFMAGAVVAWGIIAPATVATGLTHGKVSKVEPLRVNINSVNATSPRFWLLWVGVAIMLFSSIAELALSAPAIYKAMRGMFVDMYNTARGRAADSEKTDEFPDPVPREQQVQTWSWLAGLLISSVVTILVCSLQFQMYAGNVILAIFLAFVFAFVAVSSSGTTDINPLGAVAKMSQLVVGGALKAEGRTANNLAAAQLENLLAGSIASSAASHSVDMLGDLKTGHLLHASPRAQYYAQLAGSVAAIPFSVIMYVLFAKAYPCVIDGDLFANGDCVFAAPSVAAWRFVTVAVTQDNAIPASAGYTAIGLGLFAILCNVVKHFFVPKKYWPYMINWSAFGLAFVLPQVYYPVAMITGATFSYFWAKRSLAHWDMFAYVLAAGFIVGEGLAGVVNAALSIAQVDGSVYGWQGGSPPW